MLKSNSDSWGRMRQAFADQFEPEGSSFIYRRSQKGEAIRVSLAERDRFVEEFDRNLRRSMWMMWIGLPVVLGGIIGVTTYMGKDLSQIAVFAGMGLVMIPYLVFYRWVWAAPARELAGRTPVAGERSPEEVQSLKFKRITYGQLATAALGGLMLPFIGAARQDVFSGWNRLWLVFGVALVLLVAVQAIRKWRFEQEDSVSNVIPVASNPEMTMSTEDSVSSQEEVRYWRYIPLGVILLGLAFILLTPAGKRFAHTPSFMSFLMLGAGAWALFTVVQGFRIGRIEPFVRGMHDTYERATQPKRFWASMAWNSVFGCFCLGLAFVTNGQASSQSIDDQCYNERGIYSAREALEGCDKSIGANPRNPNLYVSRGYLYQDQGETPAAIADYNSAIRLQPNLAIAFMYRGSAQQHMGRLEDAIADFNEVIRLAPERPEGYFYRGSAYRELGDEDRAETDLAMASRLRQKLKRSSSG